MLKGQTHIYDRHILNRIGVAQFYKNKKINKKPKWRRKLRPEIYQINHLVFILYTRFECILNRINLSLDLSALHLALQIGDLKARQCYHTFPPKTLSILSVGAFISWLQRLLLPTNSSTTLSQPGIALTLQQLLIEASIIVCFFTVKHIRVK